MPVDPAFAPLLALLDDPSVPSLADIGPVAARQAFAAMRVDGDPTPVGSVTDRTVPGPSGEIPVRIVVPAGGAPTGVLVWFHGGGWVIGDLDTTEPVTRRLAAGAGCVVVSVDYRLAPEHPAPAGVDDAWAAVTWVTAHLDELGVSGGKVAVGGDSAGGNLAALVALRAAAAGVPLALQLLVYPATDLTMTSPSIAENGTGYFLTEEVMRWFVACNLSGGLAADDPAVSPWFASDDELRTVAPACTIVAGFDPLRDEGRAYAERLAGLGVASELLEYPTMIHGFLAMAAVTPVAVEATDAAAAALRAALAG